MAKRIGILAGAFWPIVLLLLFLGLLGDCVAAGDPETRCPQKAAHVSTVTWMAFALFLGGAAMLAYERRRGWAIFNPGWLGLAISLFFLSTYYAAAWFIYLPG